MSTYDTIIIGGGPAGLSAGIYAMRSRLNTVLVEKLAPGGQMMITDFVENFPGFPAGIGGPDLSAEMEKQARALGLEIRSSEVESADLLGAEKIVTTTDGELNAPAVILAPGASPRWLNCPGEAPLIGRGVSSCATCDGPFFREKEVAVIGGGNTALQDALFLTRFAGKVTVIHRRDSFRATRILQERAARNPKIETVMDSVVTEVNGGNSVEGVTIQNVKTGDKRTIRVSGVFVLIGTDPNTAFVKGQIVLDPSGYVITDEEMRTNVPGVFAAGDCRRKSLRQMITAASDGAIAAVSAEHYIESLADKQL